MVLVLHDALKAAILKPVEVGRGILVVDRVIDASICLRWSTTSRKYSCTPCASAAPAVQLACGFAQRGGGVSEDHHALFHFFELLFATCGFRAA